MPPKRNATALEEGKGSDNAWEGFKVAELQVQLRRRNLPVSGKKAILITRLTEYDTANPDAILPELDEGGGEGEMGGATIAPKSPPAKKKRAKKEKSPEIEVEGPLASEAIASQHIGVNGDSRPKDFVPAPDAKFKARLKKIRSERMFMITRELKTDYNGSKSQTFTIAGSTGNLYTCTIGTICRCDCQDALYRGHKCKHIGYALVVILKAPIYMCYQEGFFPEELETIFANAPVTQLPKFEHIKSNPSVYNGVRKPIQGQCSICVCDFEEGEKLVWCKAACGQNFHEECFNQWKNMKQWGGVTCVYCRQPWRDVTPPASSIDDLKAIAPKKGWHHNISGLPMYQQLGEDGASGSL